MKLLTCLFIASAYLGHATLIFAVEGNPNKGAFKRKESKAGLQKKVLEKFDANGNGKLDPDEQAAARKAAAEERKNKKKSAQAGADQGFAPAGGIDGLNGQPIGGGAAGPVGDGQTKLLQKFDFNRDGVLSPQEMSKAQEWMRRNAGPGQAAGKLPPGAARPPRKAN